jgi:CDP-diacylglycerol--serine O-phosphatidyltransferase
MDPMPEKKYEDARQASRIYVLPNLMTAGNLFCGFVAIIRCIQANLQAKFIANTDITLYTKASEALYQEAVWFILAAVIFDSLDGRLARLGGRESLFGKEFDSIADIISFGVAPALMVFFLILSPTESFPVFRRLGWLIGFIYLLCAGIRLARFNVITSPLLKKCDSFPEHDFMGLPVPAAAGFISSIVLVILNFNDIKSWALFLPGLLLVVALLMVSEIPYPSFKRVDWTTEVKIKGFLMILLTIIGVIQFHYVAIFLLFLGYISYGIFRHYRPFFRKKHGE